MARLDRPATLKDDTPLPIERRAAIRYKVGLNGTCRPALADSPRGVAAWWTDISTLGIGLIAEHPFEPQTLLVVELNGEASRPRQIRLARVRHVAPWGPNRWWLGCKLCRELTRDELQTLLARSARLDESAD
jgi:hypothetical protein